MNLAFINILNVPTEVLKSLGFCPRFSVLPSGPCACYLGNFTCFFSFADFFQNYFFRKILSGIPSECETVWTLIRTDLGPTVCQYYQQMTLIDKELQGKSCLIPLLFAIQNNFRNCLVKWKMVFRF